MPATRPLEFALNLNIHCHIQVLEGICVYRYNRPSRFQRAKPSDKGELGELAQRISQRVGRCLERQDLLEQEPVSASLDQPESGLERVAKAQGVSVHAEVSCKGYQKDGPERLCRYIARLAVAAHRLSLSSAGKVI